MSTSLSLRSDDPSSRSYADRARQRAPSILATICALLVLPACGLIGSEDPLVDGVYTGTTSIEESAWEIRLALSEAESKVITGAGSMHQVDTDRTISFQVEGVHTYPDLTLTLTSNGFEDKNFSGTVSEGGDALSGLIRDRNFVTEVDLDRAR